MKTVERDADGVVTAFRVIEPGTHSLSLDGKPYELTLDVAALRSCVEYQQKKGEPIPFDSDHYLYYLAQKHNISESEMLKTQPSGVAAAGFGTLALRGNDLWVEAIEWTPSARALHQEGCYRYYSPVFQGLKSGPVFISSIALVNEPAIDNLDKIAASATPERGAYAPVNSFAHQPAGDPGRKTTSMNRLEKVLAALLGENTVALSATGGDEALAARLEGVATTLTGLRAGHKSIRTALGLAEDAADQAVLSAITQAKDRTGAKSIRTALGLGDDAPDSAVLAALTGLKDSGTAGTTALAQIENLKLSALRKDGIAAGKLTEAMLAEDFYKGLDSVALSAYLKTAPVRVPVNGLPPANPDADVDVAVCAASTKIFDQLGLTPDEKKKAAESSGKGC